MIGWVVMCVLRGLGAIRFDARDCAAAAASLAVTILTTALG